jgi:hypothetical protein
VQPRGLLAATSSVSTAGRFGRMFRELPVFSSSPDSMIVLGAAMLQAVTANSLDEALGVADDDENTSVLSNGELRLPAGYTYFGQFVDHDITFDPASSLERQNDPDALTDFRTPRFDLDSLYGRGPVDQPYLYDADAISLLQGDDIGPTGQKDLLRVKVGDRRRAVIGDPRNDENKIVSQLQATFIRLHNRVLRWVAENEKSFTSPDDAFKRAQQLVRWHYQWVVVHDFLPRLVGDDPFSPDHGIVAEIMTPVPFAMADGQHSTPQPRERLRFYHWSDSPFMPVEFSVAAYRYGHSAIRPSYEINDFLVQALPHPRPVPGVPPLTSSRIPIFTRTPEATDSLGGFQEVPSQWGLEWKYFLHLGQPAANLPQPSYKIDTVISHPLGTMPVRVTAPELVQPGFDPTVAQALPVRNLLRGLRLGLPAGEHVALAMGLIPDPKIAVTVEVLGAAKPADLGIEPDSMQKIIDGALADFEGQTPLWYYILKEAELITGKDAAGQDVKGAHLGPVGGRIVAETLIGLLAGDPLSFINVEPNWQPIFPRRDGTTAGPFTLADLVNFALS